jgi:hypothetical protein
LQEWLLSAGEQQNGQHQPERVLHCFTSKVSRSGKRFVPTGKLTPVSTTNLACGSRVGGVYGFFMPKV